MTKTFKKLAVAGAISAVLGGAGTIANAAMDGYVGEAFLVPLVTYDVSGNQVLTNTIISVYAPGQVGQDTIPNDYTARNTTGSGSYTHPGGSSAVGYHWFYFNPESVHILDSQGTLTANDLDVIDWANGQNGGANLGLANGDWGYMILANEGAREGDAATMAMVVEAVLQVTNNAGVAENLRLPTYAMSDGVDTEGVGPRIGNECVYSSRIPTCAPLISGIRMNNGDGNPNLDVIIQMYVNRDRGGASGVDSEDLHVIWLDRNDSGRRAVPVDVFDDDEHQCSSTVDLSVELNLIHFEEINKASTPANTYQSTNLYTGQSYPFCKPNGHIDAGFVQYNIAEIGDEGGGVDSAGAAFAINACIDSNGTAMVPCSSRTLATETLQRSAGSPAGLLGNGIDYILRIAHDLGKQ